MTSHTHGYRRPRVGTGAVFVWVAAVVVLFCAHLSIAAALPDNRGYELVSPPETNGTTPGSAVPALSGNTVNFEAEGFGDAASGGFNVYQSRRTSKGWQTTALTPAGVLPSKPFSQSPPMFYTPELTQTIYLTEQPLVSSDTDERALDLYQQSPSGEVTLLSQGSKGGTGPISTTYQSATPDGNHVVFGTSESLVPAATGLAEDPRSEVQYLYDRDVPTGQTTLVNVDNEGQVLNDDGAILGNGNQATVGEPPVGLFLPGGYNGTTNHAISNDGTKIFFESPSPELSEWELRKGDVSPTVHLYMRENNSKTVPIDNPAAEGPGSRFLGASEDGTYVFFMSEEGLAGETFTDNELYMYNTDTEKLTVISKAPEGSPPVEGGAVGLTALANDGSHVYYVAKGVLAGNVNDQGQSATEGSQNLYVYDTSTGQNKFVTQLGTVEAEPESERTARLDSYLDSERQAVPTPNGEVLVFISERNLTGEDPNGLVDIYRYENSTGTLLCISCSASATGGSVLGISGPGPGGIGGGSYDPPGQSAPMTVSGDEIFFETENTLVPEDQNGSAPPGTFGNPPLQFDIPRDIDVYEWKNGSIFLISSGKPGFSSLAAVTPSGDDVFFYSSINLTSQSTGGYGALYDARVNGGFHSAELVEAAPCEDAEGCRGSSVNPVFPTPASAYPQSLSGAALAVKPEVKPEQTSTKKKKKKQQKANKKKHKPAKKKTKRKNGKKSNKGKGNARKSRSHERSSR